MKRIAAKLKTVRKPRLVSRSRRRVSGRAYILKCLAASKNPAARFSTINSLISFLTAGRKNSVLEAEIILNNFLQLRPSLEERNAWLNSFKAARGKAKYSIKYKRFRNR